MFVNEQGIYSKHAVAIAIMSHSVCPGLGWSEIWSPCAFHFVTCLTNMLETDQVADLTAFFAQTLSEMGEIKEQLTKTQQEVVKTQQEVVKTEERIIEKLTTKEKLSEKLSTIGARQLEIMAERKTLVKFQGTGRAVMEKGSDLHKALCKDKCSERQIVQLLTPSLQGIVQDVSKLVGYKLVLVNCEEHEWVVDPDKHASDIGPDLFVTHPAFFVWNEGDDDKKYGGEGFVFGKPSNFHLRDSLQGLVEIKKKLGNSTVGQIMRIADRCSRTSSSGAPIDEKRIRVNFFLLGDTSQFHLVECLGKEAVKCTFGEWTDPGSREAVIHFLSQRALENSWVHAITKLCSTFSVTIVEPTQQDRCFLGLGADGRVFQVQSEKGECYALKVALGDSKCSHLEAEYQKYIKFREPLERSKSFVSCWGHHVDDKRHFAGLMIMPVGQPLEMKMKHILSALNSLKALTEAGLKHGDARVQNVVWVMGMGKAVWLDLRWASAHNGCDQAGVFAEDVTSFVDSLIESSDKQLVASAAKEFYNVGKDSQKYTRLYSLLQPLWS